MSLANPIARAADPAQEHTPTRPSWITTADLAAASMELAAQIPADVTAVAGLPRSGLIVASLVAAVRHLALYAFNPVTNRLDPLPSTWRHAGDDSGGLVLVDDVVTTGHALWTAAGLVKQLRRGMLTAVPFANPGSSFWPDLVIRKLEPPHYLEWNFANSAHAARAAWDIDGIICQDCPPDKMSYSGDAYETWLNTVPPLYLPLRQTVPLIVTGRLEKHRRITEAWLRRYGVRWKRLEMANDYDSPAAHKAEHYRGAHDCNVFFESCPRQAAKIYAVTNKTVICPPTGEIWP